MADKDDDSTINYKLDHNVRKRILGQVTDSEDVFTGILIGDVVANCCRIISCIKCTNYEDSVLHSGVLKKPNWGRESDEIRSLIPTGLTICGVCYIDKNSKELGQPAIAEMFTSINTQDQLINDTVLLWVPDADDTAYIYKVQERQITRTILAFEYINKEFLDERVTFRLKYRFGIYAKELDDQDISVALSKAVAEQSSQLCLSSFYIPECQLLIGHGVSYDSTRTCQDLFESIIDNDQGFGRTTKHRKSKATRKDVLNVQHMTSLNITNHHDHAPVMFCRKEECNYINMVLQVDVLVMVPGNTAISELQSVFSRGIKDQLQAIMNCVETNIKASSLCLTKVYHFKVRHSPYLVTCVYPWKRVTGELFDDSVFENERSALLKKLLLPAQRPTLHPNNNYLFQDDRPQATYIINPHEGLTCPDGAGCHVAVVDGFYSYHHYMQDNFDDNRWGCAYRSLQTICSWFRHQGYTDQAVPSHRRIQEALVAVGDKQSSFIGSKKWIGSFEVNLCLEFLLGVTSKIMAVNSGEELQYRGRELIQHFENQGTPIMIGGGVLAHTILGVNFNDKTGDIKYLILDPHYTGGEDLKTILDKGWCGWKSQVFWNQRAHYNLCIPQRPDKV